MPKSKLAIQKYSFLFTVQGAETVMLGGVEYVSLSLQYTLKFEISIR